MNKRFIALLLLLTSSAPVAQPVIIIVHGTGSAHKAWWTVGGNFFKEVEQTAELLGERVVPFCWSGFPTFSQISAAGKALKHLVMSYPVTERITIIAHSHGGNVVNMASQELFNPLAKVCGGISSRPVREILEVAYQKMIKDSSQNTASFILPEQIQLHAGFDYTYTLRAVPDIKQAISNFGGSPISGKKNLIDFAIYLGTPVDEDRYKPCMDVIGSLMSCYSFSDIMQPVAGYYGRCYKKQPHIANIEILIKEKNGTRPFAPGHFGLHIPLVGRWLPLLPEVLMHSDHAAHNFKNFSFGKNGIIVFDEAKGPMYLLESGREAYLAKYKTLPQAPAFIVNPKDEEPVLPFLENADEMKINLAVVNAEATGSLLLETAKEAESNILESGLNI